MPIFEYACHACGHRFEELVLGAESPRCPACEGDRLEKLLSRFGVGDGATSAAPFAPPGACGTCGDPRGPGACAL